MKTRAELEQIVKGLEAELKAMGDKTPLPMHGLELQFVPDEKQPCVTWLFQLGMPGISPPEDIHPEDYERISAAGLEGADRWIQNKLAAAGVTVKAYDFMVRRGKRYMRWPVIS